MRIGLLAYHSACNFGATLQLLSTYKYLEKAGHNPLVINWIPLDLEAFYKKRTPKEQFINQQELRKIIWEETPICRTDEEIATVINKLGIDAVIIGSDAVAQHHPWQERLIFPTRRLFSIIKYTSDRMFPNPYWGTFNNNLKQSVPTAVISASCQDSAYKFIPRSIRKIMTESLSHHSYYSVRDTWTQEMISSITKGKITPDITPDPVFAFNYNASEITPSRKEITERYQLPEKYLLLSFFKTSHVTSEWITSFCNSAHLHGYKCIVLPFSMQNAFGVADQTIKLPLSPLEWYALIKYSSGYVGNNMHPIVVSIHNEVPFYSFDNYGIKHLRGHITSDKSSKIRHLLTLAGFESSRVSCISNKFTPPSPELVLNHINNFDKAKAHKFAEAYYTLYTSMMKTVLSQLATS